MAQVEHGRLGVVHGRVEKGFLGGEAVEDAAFGNAGAAGDFDGAGLAEAVGQEDRARGVQDLLVGNAGGAGHF